MNIIVKPYGSGLCYCRPDTTWEREEKDFYSPECIDEIHWAPVIFVRICKAGKCINPKFASRYYDAFNFGALMYCHAEGGCNETAFTSCADHTSLLPFPLYNPVVMENEENIFEVRKNGEVIFSMAKVNDASDSAVGERTLKDIVEEAICKASMLTSLRTGDFVAAELVPASPLTDRNEEDTSFKATYCGNDLYDIKLIF